MCECLIDAFPVMLEVFAQNLTLAQLRSITDMLNLSAKDAL